MKTQNPKDRQGDELAEALRFMSKRAAPDRRSIPSLSLVAANSLASIRASNGIKRGTRSTLAPTGETRRVAIYTGPVPAS